MFSEQELRGGTRVPTPEMIAQAVADGKKYLEEKKTLIHTRLNAFAGAGVVDSRVFRAGLLGQLDELTLIETDLIGVEDTSPNYTRLASLLGHDGRSIQIHAQEVEDTNLLAYGLRLQQAAVILGYSPYKLAFDN